MQTSGMPEYMNIIKYENSGKIARQLTFIEHSCDKRVRVETNANSTMYENLICDLINEINYLSINLINEKRLGGSADER